MSTTLPPIRFKAEAPAVPDLSEPPRVRKRRESLNQARVKSIVDNELDKVGQKKRRRSNAIDEGLEDL